MIVDEDGNINTEGNDTANARLLYNYELLNAELILKLQGKGYELADLLKRTVVCRRMNQQQRQGEPVTQVATLALQQRLMKATTA